jgi:multiple sugar transport system ATP-binding protein
MVHSVSVRDLKVAFNGEPVLKGLTLDIADGEFIVLLGASGCGKSTLLNAIAGLLDIADGEIWINGKNVTWHEPKDRGIGMVFQSYALYPRMSVRKNLSFGLRISGIDRTETARRVAQTAELLQLTALLDRMPAALSGGQRQRVAIGRAMVRHVDVFLFDEPLSNLDAKLRAELRVEIKKLHQTLRNTMIYVTHDQTEALTLADRIAVMRHGEIQQLSTPYEIYHRPTNRYVAEFVGSPAINMIEGVLDRATRRFHLDHSDEAIDLSGYEFADTTTSRPAVIGIRPEHFMIGQLDGPGHLASGKVTIVEPMGADTVVWSDYGGVPIRIRTGTDQKVAVGDILPFSFDPSRASLFDAEVGLRL